MALLDKTLAPLNISGETRANLLKAVLTVAALGGVLLMPPQAGLSPQGQKILAICAAAVVLWSTEVVPIAVTSLLVTALLMVMGDLESPSEALVGFTSPVLFFLIGSMVMGAAVMRSGLAERLASYLVVHSGGSSKKLIGQLVATMPLMGLIIPAASNRNAMLIPAYERVFHALGVGRGDPLPRTITLILGLLNTFLSSAYLTGGAAPMLCATLLGGFSWFRWFLFMAVPFWSLLILGSILIFLIYRPQDTPPMDMSTLLAHRKALSREETTTLVVITGASLLWLTDFLHHWNSAIPALMAAVALMAPGVGVLTWSEFEKRVGWSIVFAVGASLSLAEMLVSSGAAAWFAQGLLGLLAHGSVSPPAVAVFVILVATVVHLAVPNFLACLALLIPVVAAIARATGTDPVAAGLMVLISIDAVILYPVQTVANLLAYERGYFDGRDVLRIGLGMLALTIGVILLIAIPWWGVLGLPFAR